MVERLTTQGGVRLTDDEWHRLTEPLHLGGSTLQEVFQVLAGRIDASYNVAHTVRELINAGEPGSPVPPTDLPAAIRRIGDARHAAEQQARTFAGEIADLTDTLHDRLPDVFEAVLEEIADGVVRDMTGETSGDAAELVVEAGTRAYAIALRLVTSFDVRDRDQAARPAMTPAEFYDATRDPDTHRFTITLDADESPFVRKSPGTMTNAEPITAEASRTQTLYGVPISDAHPLVTYLAEHLGPLKPCDGSMTCKRALVANVLLDAAADFTNRGDRIATADGTPLDRWIMRAAERLADHCEQLHLLGDLAVLIRRGVEYAARVIERSKPCTICDGVGGPNGSHRLGCPNATVPTGT